MEFQIITFYEFKDLCSVNGLVELRETIRDEMRRLDIYGTVILAEEGYNSTVCGRTEPITEFVDILQRLLKSEITYKSSFSDRSPFRRIDVKIKPEIVTLKQKVDISLGTGTHVKPADWNDLVRDERTLLIDARNDYEHKSGTFFGAVNPGTSKFSELPDRVKNELARRDFDRVAMFCTGGIRCEKFAPYMRQMGFENVFQLEGGILRYLEDVPAEESLWEGECFVFDDRITVDHTLRKGSSPDHSQKAVASTAPRSEPSSE